ncbi:MAG: aminomethyl-transferring glycine dehydrogenase subunit GcvPA [Hyphomicrobiales bacterium]|nr:aminomethyl-transferring glycine dehydrogenase subunit GcvPA [Hyphomicrobiales bacterium]
MSYIPHTDAERRDMLAAIGVADMAELFADIPERVRFPKLRLPQPASELDIAREMRALAARNHPVDPSTAFLGAGTYQHFRPATVDYVLSRSEFYTSYTQYQPEVSQGMLQALFEYQTMVCRLTGMDVSNASHYDGATALAEAVLLALTAAQGKRRKIILSPGILPQYREVVKTYLCGTDAATVTGDENRTADINRLASLLDEDTAAVALQTPNFFGQCEAVDGLAEAAHRAGALLIVVTDPIALGLFRPPGQAGADIVVADGQSLGIPPSFGGPHLGIFATRMAHVRRLPGHLVGETVDRAGRRGYVLTLATREQHIRRAKATSNICTNSAICALAAATYLATVGKSGLRQIAELCYHRSHYAAAEIARLKGFSINPQAPEQPFFKEFVVGLPRPAAEVNRHLRERHGIIGGYDLSRDFPDLARHMLLAVTEVNPRAAIDRLVRALGEIAQ